MIPSAAILHRFQFFKLPPRKLTSPLKGELFQRNCRLPTINVHGIFVSFQGGTWFSLIFQLTPSHTPGFPLRFFDGIGSEMGQLEPLALVWTGSVDGCSMGSPNRRRPRHVPNDIWRIRIARKKLCKSGLLDCLAVEGLEIGHQEYAIPGSVVMDLKKTRLFLWLRVSLGCEQWWNSQESSDTQTTTPVDRYFYIFNFKDCTSP